MKVELKRIMCAADFSDFSDHACLYGIALAKEYKAKLYMCHVVDLPSAAIYEEGISDPLEQQNRFTNYAREYINKFIGDQPLDWEPVIKIGQAANELTRVAEEKDVDLVISATHGRSGLTRLILGSVAERIMHTLPCPLLVAHSPEKDSTAFDGGQIRFQRILVGCDFSSDSSLAFEYALSLAQEFQSELHLIHVIEPNMYEDLLELPIDTEDDSLEFLSGRIDDKLKNMVPEGVTNWCSLKTSPLIGQSHEELISYAELNEIDLIVLGVRGHGLVEKLFVGSTTDRVVRQAKCPVLCVRPTIRNAQVFNGLEKIA